MNDSIKALNASLGALKVRLRRIACKVLGHAPSPFRVILDWGFPADRFCYCSRCGLEGVFRFESGEYRCEWPTKT